MDTNNTTKITVQSIVNVNIEKAWHLWTNPEDIKAWNNASDDWHTTHAVNNLRSGGSFNYRMEAKDGSFGFDFEGTYTRVIEFELIEYSFGARLASVSFQQEEAGVRVMVEFDAEEENSPEDQRQGWQAILDNFARHVLAK